MHYADRCGHLEDWSKKLLEIICIQTPGIRIREKPIIDQQPRVEACYGRLKAALRQNVENQLMDDETSGEFCHFVELYIIEQHLPRRYYA